ncbi:MAG: hypothetical protein LQ343_003702 [Gyalolechia ehrenbergii]|nr:MAG: hypothetical protein LQ343_003702 [Gyalolechia ehrenbergii]
MPLSIERTVPQNLSARIQNAIPRYPDLADLFHDIAAYIAETTTLLHLQPNPQQQQDEPKSKKRKLSPSIPDHDAADSITDLSFSIPQRKKLKLEFSRNRQEGALRATNPTTTSTEFSLQWQEIEYCVCVPVPEKAQPQYNYCIFPRDEEHGEQILFTVPGGKMKPEAITCDDVVDPEESYKDVVTRMLNKRLKNPVLEPDEKEFVSQVAQAHRKGEKAVHVKAFRGSKDGFLFLLPLGILHGFKKPLSFFPFHAIHSISYTSILQRTFNLNISVFPTSSSSSAPTSSPSEPKEYEFSMVDQADFSGIDAYVRRHGLQDASMAEQRRAKRLNINGVGKVKGDGEDGEGGAGDDEEGELAKAAREVEEMDDEDEEEDENFDPGSEGESEGSGESSEEDEGDGQGNGGGDIVGEELGSEAEDVSEYND